MIDLIELTNVAVLLLATTLTVPIFKPCEIETNMGLQLTYMMSTHRVTI